MTIKKHQMSNLQLVVHPKYSLGNLGISPPLPPRPRPFFESMMYPFHIMDPIVRSFSRYRIIDWFSYEMNFLVPQGLYNGDENDGLFGIRNTNIPKK